MAAQTSMVHVRVDENTKADAAEVLDAIGLTVSDAVRLFLHRVAADQAFPLELKVPNAVTRAAMAESNQLLLARKARFADGNALIAHLEKASAK